ncbi:PilZ domain-containing protein [Rhodobacteraceae bacterium RKSG542]|uniref:PilZ domain-containing protein n=1 Tax=Pseudovibrio flavus TaxID=2529854 RepID=UPI0012BCC778|nr:PilZ domain-containing protein [Pseudovibrio flavus]MTI19359.1 PilZ domain-containing protein [Pseudovibrio flavus]
MASRHAALLKKIAEREPDKRRFSRVDVNVLGRFMLEDRREYPCQIINMSPGGAALIAPVTGTIGERVIAYIDHVGRIEGSIARHIDGGFAIDIRATARKRDKLASILTWLANRDRLNLPEDRRHERFVPQNPFTTITLDDKREYKCKIIDVSLSGAALKTDVRPALGLSIAIGKMRARVIRHTEDGIAVEFAVVQNRSVLEQHITQGES